MRLTDNKTDFEKVIILKIVAEKQNTIIQELLSDVDEAKFIIRDLKQALHDKSQQIGWTTEEKAGYRKTEYYKQLRKEQEGLRKSLKKATTVNSSLISQLIKLQDEKAI